MRQRDCAQSFHSNCNNQPGANTRCCKDKPDKYVNFLLRTYRKLSYQETKGEVPRNFEGNTKPRTLLATIEIRCLENIFFAEAYFHLAKAKMTVWNSLLKLIRKSSLILDLDIYRKLSDSLMSNLPHHSLFFLN